MEKVKRAIKKKKNRGGEEVKTPISFVTPHNHYSQYSPKKKKKKKERESVEGCWLFLIIIVPFGDGS